MVLLAADWRHDDIQAPSSTSVRLYVAPGCTTLHAMGSEAILKALAEPRRQAILRLVRDRPRSVNEIGTHFDISQQAVSQHLQVLAEAGLVVAQPLGRQRLYVVDPKGLEVLERFLAELWPKGLDRLKRAVETRRGR
jgi:DNA-binding transcriptional ArsR family regulator